MIDEATTWEVRCPGFIKTRREWLNRPGEHTWTQQARELMLAELGGPFNGQTVMDIGSSGGHGAKSFLGPPLGNRTVADNVTYLGIDNEPAYIKLGEEFYADTPQVTFSEHDITSSEAFPRRAAFVMCNAVVEHLPDYRAALCKMLAATKTMLVWRTLLGAEFIEYREPNNKLWMNQYAFGDVFATIFGEGFEPRVVRDRHYDGMPQLEWGHCGLVRTYYIVTAKRKT